MENLAAQDGELYYLPGFLPPDMAASLFQRLRGELDWQQEVATIVGRRVPIPRLVCWHGDADAVYRYSGLVHEPKPWTETLAKLKQSIEAICGNSFNSVLGNLYRDGEDSMGWHADQEASLGRNPYIASLSLGAVRLFKIRHTKTGETLNLRLADGSLLLMGGALQHHWRHCVPKTRIPTEARINLTFRKIVPGA
ncbi:MAG: alpha-ketoglutarate-dependent dioxygenase AlkB family protein [Candidatus Methylumidiphilus sp.]